MATYFWKVSMAKAEYHDVSQGSITWNTDGTDVDLHVIATVDGSRLVKFALSGCGTVWNIARIVIVFPGC